MIYPSDFNFYPTKIYANKINNNERKFNTLQIYDYDGNKNEKVLKKFNIKRKIITAPRRNINQKEEQEIEFNNNISLWERYCLNSTVHGLRYITDRKLHLTER